jgi:hypothetical protein
MGNAICIVIIILLIALFWYNQNTEHFDTYYNHDFGAYNVYKNEEKKPLSVDNASLEAKYQWGDRDVAGYTVYDKMYDAAVKEKNWTSDRDYGYRDVDTVDLDNVYDTKFSVLNNENELSNYNALDMYDPYVVQNVINGQKVSLAQKQY